MSSQGVSWQKQQVGFSLTSLEMKMTVGSTKNKKKQKKHP